MADANPAPDGYHTVTPRIVASDAKGLVDFIRHVFSASGSFEAERPSMVRIGDSLIMISETGERHATPAFLYVYVADVDATLRRAVASGVRVLEKTSTMPYGERRCMFEDRWGNVWQVASRAEKDRNG